MRTPTRKRHSAISFSRTMAFHHGGRRRSTYSAITTGRGVKVSSCPTTPDMRFKTRRKPFPPPRLSRSPRFRLMDLGIGSRRDLCCDRRVANGGFRLACRWPIFGQHWRLLVLRGRRRAIGVHLLRLRAAGYRSGRLELAAERFRAAERIGLKSKSIGGQETIAYDTSAMSAPIQAMLQPYKRAIL
jgi:hypothetical protein